MRARQAAIGYSGTARGACGVGHRRTGLHGLCAGLLAASAVVMTAQPAVAQATWIGNDGDYNDGANWTGNVVPFGVTETAIFGNSGTTGVVVSVAQIGGWTFASGAADYTIEIQGNLYFEGAGIEVDGGSLTLRNRSFLYFYNSSTAGDATITTTGITILRHLSSGGNARFVTELGGELDISGLSSAETTAGSIGGSGDYQLGNKRLTTGSNNLSTEVSGIIDGVGGELFKVGTGTLTLSGDNTYSGATTVWAGTLVVDGSLVSAASVDGGGRLGGTGTLNGGVTIWTGGTLAPGNSIGTLNVTGNTTFGAGSFYEVEVDAAGRSDKTVVTGVATLDGTVTVVGTPGAYAPATDYTILTANSLSGTFDGVTSNLAFLDPSLSYDATNVYLRLQRNGLSLASAATSPNQQGVAGGTGALGPGNPVYDAVIGLTAAEAAAAFDALSGEVHAALQGALVGQSAGIRQAALGRLEQSFAALPPSGDAVSAYAADGAGPVAADAGTGLWGHLQGGLAASQGDGNAAATTTAATGLALGADGQLGAWRVGVLGHAGTSWLEVPERGATADSTDYGAGLYAGLELGDTRLGLGAVYTRHQIDSRREVAFPGFTETLTADYAAATAQLFGELGHEIELGDFSLTPFAGLAHVSHATDGFTEQGGAAALTSAAAVFDATFTTLGLRAEHRSVVGETGLLGVSGGIGWRHAFAALPTARNAFAGGAGFTVAGTPIAADALVLEAGLHLDLNPQAQFTLAYDGQIGAGGQAHALKGTFGGEF